MTNISGIINNKVLGLILLIIIFAFGCASGGSGYENISAEEAKKQLDVDSEIILLDVRTPAEHFEANIPNSLLIPVDVIKQEAPELLPDKDATIFVYCRSGRRSVTASLALVEMGYTSVYNLGGIIDWPYEIQRG
ncbi:rhodanese-like domain-containing protein [Dethiobacter alkaliphilus]|uniref:rhodanese-like domain-containing protein n=1 Tax=Dethiobacter alkaliphilus TaxID=427926 RepID=UPI002226B663|nr:rhodanese-like domain-containing protein [Dethiobacter alkaliphilus]MCW3490478.1 rhodanese-like domain-containing protein [Dethiobacter alkaliphilus]